MNEREAIDAMTRKQYDEHMNRLNADWDAKCERRQQIFKEQGMSAGYHIAVQDTLQAQSLVWQTMTYWFMTRYHELLFKQSDTPPTNDNPPPTNDNPPPGFAVVTFLLGMADQALIAHMVRG